MEKKDRKGMLKRMVRGCESYLSVLGALILISALWGMMTPYYFTFANLKNILVYIAANGVMAVGMTIVMLLGGLDLSQMSLMALAGMVAGFLFDKGWGGGWVLIAAAVLTGIVGGLLNGILVSAMNIAPFVATLGTQLVFRALAYIITSGKYLAIKDPIIRFIGFDTVLGLPTMFWIMAAVYIVIGLMLRYTRFGRNIYSVGGSRTAARLSGIYIRKTEIICYAISGLTCGIGAILYMAQGSIAMNNAGEGSEMDVISAVVLGGVSMAGGRGTVLNTLLGIVLLSVISNGMSLLSMDSYYKMLIKGVILLAAVFIDTLRERNK